jgi:D-serine deaminase-like pyridoxal phosphate-dependent protein
MVDYEKLLCNIHEMQRAANEAGVALRPHTKTHKCPDLAKLQLREGGSGICVQKLGEAEVMVGAGIEDVFITNEVVEPTKIERLVKLQEKAIVKVAVDAVENAQLISKTAAATSLTVPVLIEVDSGLGRCGVPFGRKAVKLAKELLSLKGLKLEGLMTHEGHLYHVKNKRRRIVLAQRAMKRYVETASEIRKAGIDVPIVSCGSTPTATTVMHCAGITEIQPGNYVFYDLNQVELGAAKIDDCAQRVLSTVISVPSPTRCVVDVGTKAFCHDLCRFPKSLEALDIKPIQIHEEHLTLKINPRRTQFRVGDRIHFIPYHACTATNMHEEIQVIKGSEVVATWPVAARGKMR